MPRALTQKIVDAAETRMRNSMGGLSVRAALLLDRRDRVTEADIAAWMAEGSRLQAENLTSSHENLSERDRLHLQLVELDSYSVSRPLLLAGEALQEIVTDRSPRNAGNRTRVAIHLRETLAPERFGPKLTVEHRDERTVVRSELEFSQAEMDLLTAAELDEYEAILAQRRELADRARALIERARGRTSDGVTVH